jgi:polysaccharide export outer membrane protein
VYTDNKRRSVHGSIHLGSQMRAGNSCAEPRKPIAPALFASILVSLALYGQGVTTPAGQAVPRNQPNQNQNQPDPPGAVKVPAPKAGEVAGDTATGLAVDTKSYVIGPEDILGINVWREDTLSHQYGVRPDGMITLPLVRDIKAAGLTPDELTQELTKALSQFLTKPEITVTVLQINSKKYFVNGEVNRPGQYPLVTPIKLFDAINLAGGFRDFANRKNIVIMRGDKRLKFNYEEVLKGKKLEQNLPVENGDNIIVK